MFHSLARLVSVLIFTFATLGLCNHAAAQHARTHLYQANGTAQFAPNQSDFTGQGDSTCLGSYTEVGNVVFAPTSTPGVFAVTGWTNYTAANNDVLHALVCGTVDMTTGAILAVATYAGGTGSFANATGGSLLWGQMLGGGALTISAFGLLRF